MPVSACSHAGAGGAMAGRPALLDRPAPAGSGWRGELPDRGQIMNGK
jgi:hypothetical protein